jgi:Protein of unknown function (DUF3352)
VVRRRASIAAVLGSLALAACGDDGGEATAGPAGFVPPETPMYLEASRQSEDQVANAEALIAELGEVPLLGTPVDPLDLLEQEIDEAAADEGLDLTFADDIEPWLGERAAVAIPSVEELVAEESPGVLAVVEVTDEEAARAVLDRLVAPADEVQVVEEEVGGQTVLRPEGEEGGAAIIDGFLVFGNTDEALEQGFSAHDGDSLADSDDFEAAFEGLPEERLADGYLDLGGIIETGVAAGEIQPEEIEAIRGLYGDGFEQPLAVALSAGDRTLAVDVAGPSAFGTGPPRIGATDLVGGAPGNAIAAIGLPDLGGQVDAFLEFLEANGALFGEQALGPGGFAEGFEAEVGVPLDTVIEAAGDAALHLRGELPFGFVIGGELALSGEGLPPEVYEWVAGELEREGFRIGSPLSGSTEGFSAERNAAGGDVGFVNVEAEPDAAIVTVAPDRAVADEAPPSADALGDHALFEPATAALGDDFELAGFADLGPILDGFIEGGSLLDLATGEVTPEQAMADFLAGKLGYAALGVRTEDDRTVQRLVVGLE